MKHFLFVFIFTSIPFFFCTNLENNPADPQRPGIQIVSESGIKKDTITGYANLDIGILISVRFPDELDSLSYHTGNGFSGSLSRINSSESLSIILTFTAPCTTSLIVTGLKNDLEVTSDTAVIFVSEPLTVKMTPFRLYASPCLPCTLKASVSNYYRWQQITLIPQITTDSLLVWTPTENEIGKRIPVTMIAVVNGMTPVIAKDSVFITVIADNELLLPPDNLKIDRRTDNVVKISWDRVLLADSYVLYLRDPDKDSAWDTITLPGTSYIDLAENAKMYRVSSVNYFGVSVPSEMIYGIDTVHYAHRIFFADSFSAVSESAVSHFIKLHVARPAVNEITVWCSLSGNSEITTDFGSSVYLTTIAPGDTFGLCTLSIIDDSIIEQNKTFSISIDSVSHGYISGQKVHNILLADDDSLLSVIYDANGAETGNVPVDLRHYNQKDTVVVMGNTGNLVKDGFSFVGWKNGTEKNGKLYNPGDTLILNAKAIRLYAQWQVTKYSVIYDGNGNTEGLSSFVEEYGYDEVIIAAKPEDLVKTGFTFKEWNTVKNGTGESFLPGDSLKKTATRITLYALWEKSKYTVKYDGNGNDSGSVPDSAVYEYGTKVIVQGNPLSLQKKYCLFNGWNTSHDGSGIDFAPGDSFFLRDSDVTLYAQWKSIPPAIITHPKDTSVRAGNRVFLTVQVSGVGLSYQWKKNGTDISGATSDTLVIDTVTRNDSASYNCIAGNTEGSVISDPAVLTVISAASVSAGEDHTLILMSDGTAWGCGSNENGQLDIGTEKMAAIPVYLMSDVSMVSVGAKISYLLTKHGNLLKIQNNSRTILDSEVASISAIPHTEYVMVLKNNNSLWLYYPSDRIWLSDSTTSFHGSCSHILITKGNNLYAFGSNIHGQFGNGTNKDASEFILIKENVSSAVAGIDYTLILQNGSLYSAGYNRYGQLGNGTFQNSSSFTPVESEVAAISGYYYHSMIIKGNGSLYGTGFNEFGQLGIGLPLDNRASFVFVMKDVASVSAGHLHTMIIKKDGTLWATGYNGSGRLGIGAHDEVDKPELVKF